MTDGIDWRECFRFAASKALADTGAVSITCATEVKNLAREALHDAGTRIQHLVRVRGGLLRFDCEQLLELEATVIRELSFDSIGGVAFQNEYRHAARRLFTYMHDYLRQNRVPMPDVFWPYNPSSIIDIDKTDHRRSAGESAPAGEQTNGSMVVVAPRSFAQDTSGSAPANDKTISNKPRRTFGKKTSPKVAKPPKS